MHQCLTIPYLGCPSVQLLVAVVRNTFIVRLCGIYTKPLRPDSIALWAVADRRLDTTWCIHCGTPWLFFVTHPQQHALAVWHCWHSIKPVPFQPCLSSMSEGNAVGRHLCVMRSTDNFVLFPLCTGCQESLRCFSIFASVCCGTAVRSCTAAYIEFSSFASPQWYIGKNHMGVSTAFKGYVRLYMFVFLTLPVVHGSWKWKYCYFMNGSC